MTATDLSDRALRFAATTAALNGLSWELLAGDLLAPVAGRRFDLVVSNPPFVIGPGATRYTYRDSGRAGDAVCAELAAAAPDLLTEGGTLQFLANWLHVAGEDWHDRVAGWVAGTGCDAWIVQREVSDPVEYVNLWLRDASEAFDPARAQAWLDWFDANRIEGVGYGLVTLAPQRPRRSGGTGRGPAPGAGPLAGRADSGLVRPPGLARRAPGPAGRRLHPGRRAAADPAGRRTTERTGWSAGRCLTLTDGLRWAEEVDPVALALIVRRRRDSTAARPARPCWRSRSRPRCRCSPRWPYPWSRTWSNAGSSNLPEVSDGGLRHDIHVVLCRGDTRPQIPDT